MYFLIVNISSLFCCVCSTLLQELEAVLLVVADLLLLLALDTSALDISDRPHGGAHRHRQHHRQQRPMTSSSADEDRTVVVTRGSAPCRPIPHEVLWRKLDIVASRSKRHRRMPKSASDDDRGRQEDVAFDDKGIDDDIERLAPAIDQLLGRQRAQLTVDRSDAFGETRVTSELNELLLDILERQNIEDATSSSSTPLSRQQRRRRNVTSSYDDLVEISSSVSSTAERVHSDRTSISDDVTSVVEQDDQLPSVEFRSRYRQMAQLRSKNNSDGTTTGVPLHNRSGHSSAMVADAIHQQHQCRLETYWKKMPEGTFPPYLETGRCRQTTCMFGLYECRPRRYTVKILRRMPRRCSFTARHPVTQSPLVVDESSSAIEEVWRFVEYPVIVGCDCSIRRQAGTFGGGKTGKHQPQR